MKKTIKRSRVDGFAHHLQLKTPTLASEQRNAHLNHLNCQESAAPKQTNKLGQSGGQSTHPSGAKKKRLPPSPTPPTAAPPETGEVKKTNLKLPEEFLWKKV